MKLLIKNLFNLNKFNFIKNEEFGEFDNSVYDFNIVPDYILNEFINEINNTNKTKKDKYKETKTILGVFIIFYFCYAFIKYFNIEVFIR